MKYSVRRQERYYEERPLAQKKSKALNLLGSVAPRRLGEGLLEILSNKDKDFNIKYLPAPKTFLKFSWLKCSRDSLKSISNLSSRVLFHIAKEASFWCNKVSGSK